jgi:hypothetical protein
MHFRTSKKTFFVMAYTPLKTAYGFEGNSGPAGCELRLVAPKLPSEGG